MCTDGDKDNTTHWFMRASRADKIRDWKQRAILVSLAKYARFWQRESNKPEWQGERGVVIRAYAHATYNAYASAAHKYNYLKWFPS